MTAQIDGAIERAIHRKLRRPEIYDPHELACIGSLWIEFAKTLKGIEYVPNIEVLRIFDGCVDDFGVVVRLSSLEVLAVTRSTLASLDELASANTLVDCQFQCNLITELSPLERLPNLGFLYVQGNPLSPESYHEVIPKLQERGVRVKYSNEEEWALCRELWERDPRATYGVASGTSEQQLIVPEVSCARGQPFCASISPEDLRRELDNPDFDAVEVVERYMPQPFTAEGHREKADAAGAHQWIDASELDADEKKLMHGFVDRFDDLLFVREDDEILDERADSCGHYWRPWPPTTSGQRERLAAIPGWFRRYRKTLAFARPSADEEAQACVSFSRLQDEAVDTLIAKNEFNLGAVGAASYDVQMSVVDRHKVMPIGWGGEDNAWALGVAMGDGTDDKVYVFRAADSFAWDFDPRRHVAFESIGQMFAAVDKIRSASTCETQVCSLDVSPWYGEEPPEVDFDLSAHRIAQNATRARQHIEASDLDAPTQQALVDFVDGFESLGFVREDEAALEYWEVCNQTRFPAWYRQLRQVLAFPRVTHNKLWVRFSAFEDGWSGFPGVDGFEIHAPRVWDVGTRRRLVDEHGVVTIGHAIHYEMVIRVGDAADGRIYFFDTSEFGEENFDPCGSVAFTSAAQMFERIRAVELVSNKVIRRRK